MSTKKEFSPGKSLRNQLDYILTDLMPFEIPEAYSHYNFYKYLYTHSEELRSAIDECKKNTTDYGKREPRKIFDGAWSAIPLTFEIFKNGEERRTISLLHPHSLLHIYLFMACYDKNILLELNAHNTASLRFHSPNRSLRYLKLLKNEVQYFEEVHDAIGKRIIQQSNAYFNIKPYRTLPGFADSKRLLEANRQFAYYARTDYKLCFDSIYSHTYSWVKNKDVIDSKKGESGNLYVTIDRLLQDINAKLSHGVPVGPEFSRMIVELLLQNIDQNTIHSLHRRGMVYRRDYIFFRYVDDFFIFAHNERDTFTVLNQISEESAAFKLALNTAKTNSGKTPLFLNSWKKDIAAIADNISSCFLDNKINERSYISNVFKKLPNDFLNIIISHPDAKKSIVAYISTTIQNKFEEDNNLLQETHVGIILRFIRFFFFILGYAPGFDIIQRLISLLFNIDRRISIKNHDSLRNEIQKVLYDNKLLFENACPNDMSNLILSLGDFGLHFSVETESNIANKIFDGDNPLMIATWMRYSRYNANYAMEIERRVCSRILCALEIMKRDEILLRKEMWYIFIFINCPYISPKIKNFMRARIKSIQKMLLSGKIVSSAAKCDSLLYKFLLSPNENKFFDWGLASSSVATSALIAYRTKHRTIFRGEKYSFDY